LQTLIAKYTSPEIQKEVLSIFACEVRKYIREEIRDKYNYEDIMKEFTDAKSQRGVEL
jgi:hypothetical protein